MRNLTRHLWNFNLIRICATSLITLSVWASLWLYEWIDVHMGTKYAVTYAITTCIVSFAVGCRVIYLLAERKLS